MADRALADWTAEGRTPAAAYLQVDAEGLVFERHVGTADLATARPVASDTTMMAYSMSKVITAVAVLQLAGAVVIDLDSPVSQYLPIFPYGDRVTVRHLLAHRGGLPNPIPLRWVHSIAAHGSFDEAGALAAVLRRHPRVRSAPGTQYVYSNIGYWLLGGLVERVTGVPFPVYVTRRIFEPLGLTPADAGYLIVDPDRHATGYLERYSILNLFRPLLIDRDLIGSHHGPWVEVHAHYADGPAFGGVVCTARALGTLLTDQLRPQSVLLDHAMQSLLYTAERPFEGATWPVTAGWHVAERGTFGTYFFKEGGGGGFHGMMRLYRERGRGSVLVTNATAFDVNDGLDALDAVLLAQTVD